MPQRHPCPVPPDEGVQFRVSVVTLPVGSRWWRVHRGSDPLRYSIAPTHGGRIGNRFDPMAPPFSSVEVLYAAQGREAAVCETVLRWQDAVAGPQPIPRSMLRDRALSCIRLRRELKLIELCALVLHPVRESLPGIVPENIVLADWSSYGATRVWASRLREQAGDDVAGLLWMSRQYNTARCVVLWRDRVGMGDLECASIAPEALDGNTDANRLLRTLLQTLGWDLSDH